MDDTESGSEGNQGLVGKAIGDGGRYLVQDLIGEGGMGLVFLALDRRMSRQVVVKVPQPAFLIEPGFSKRFRNEIRSLTELEHAHIVRVYDQGTCRVAGSQVPFAVLQHLGGGNLDARMQKLGGREPPRSVLEWLLPVARALDFIHEHPKKYVHRDVKPANILFDAEGVPYLSDFGIAKALGESSTGLTQHGTPGTPAYMPPELDDPKSAGPASDQFALAATVYRALSGRLPFEGTGTESRRQKEAHASKDLRELVSGFSRLSAAAVRRALAPAPRDRFESCTAFASEFQAGLEARDASQPPAAPVRVSRRAFVAAGLVVVLATAAAGVWLGLRGRGHDDAEDVSTNPPSARKESKEDRVLDAPALESLAGVQAITAKDAAVGRPGAGEAASPRPRLAVRGFRTRGERLNAADLEVVLDHRVAASDAPEEPLHAATAYLLRDVPADGLLSWDDLTLEFPPLK